MSAERGDSSLELAARVAGILAELGVDSALIGAAALAVYGYPRATRDIDLAVATDPFMVLREAERRIESELGVEARLITPDGDDPLGGVLSVAGEGLDPVQVVNFLNPLSPTPNPGREAVSTATAGLLGSLALRVVTLPYLVALKLYAGGFKSQLDVLELLERNPAHSRDDILAVCARFGLDDALRGLLDRRRY